MTSTDVRRGELATQRRKVDFDTYDVTVDELVRRVGTKRIDIAPSYQRQFRWDAIRQSRLVESVLLGIPVPPLFMATNITEGQPSRWEVVDGLQRLLTLVNFAGPKETRKAAGLDERILVLDGMDKLTGFDGASYEDLPEDIRTSLLDRPMKVVILNDKSDLQVRYDLFERLNTGGIRLTPQEIRECVFRGEFVDLLTELANSKDFRTVVKLPSARWRDGTPQDYVLRFFAFTERYSEFDHSVTDFLNDYISDAVKDPRAADRRAEFTKTFALLSGTFPDGVKTRKGATPVNLFEGLSAGAALALRQNGSLKPPTDVSWVSSPELRSLTTGATNSKLRVVGRVEFCRERFLAAAS